MSPQRIQRKRLSTDQDEIRRRQLDSLDQMERRAEEQRRREAEGT